MSSPTRPDESDVVARPDWSFARRPFWLFSHLFALSVVVLFTVLGLWQLSRHDDRQSANAVIDERLSASPIVVQGADDLAPPAEELEFRPAEIVGSWDDGQVALVANRSQGGTAGVHVVGVVALADGTRLAVNRGFLPTGVDDLEPAAVPDGPVRLSGWLQPSVQRGRFGASDPGTGMLIPRLNTDSVADRIGADVADVWLQLADTDTDQVTFPDPVPLPPLDDGPHLGYAAQWFIFAVLGVLFYGALLRRQSRTG